MKVGFIGVGNMGGAILKGFVGSNPEKASVCAFDTDEDKLEKLSRELGIGTCGSIGELVAGSDLVVIGIKPNHYDGALPQVADAYDHKKILISMAAGIKISHIEGFVGSGAKIIRIMPNTPAMVGEGMTAVCRNSNISEEDMRSSMILLNSFGKTCEVAESQIHCVIGVSGSSPAYTYMYIDALAEAAVKNGMEKDQAIIFAAQSVLGAAKMVLETGVDPVQLRINVCSPGGATIEAVHKLQENGFVEKIEEGFQAAVEKSKKMSGE